MLLDLVQDVAGAPLPDAVAARVRWMPARLPSRGDLSTDAALLTGQSDRGFAARLAERLAMLPPVQEVRVAGAGFINLTYADTALDGVLPSILGGLPHGGPPAVAITWPPASMRRADPDFMVQYAHARCRSVLRAAAGRSQPDGGDCERLGRSAEGRFLTGPARALLCRLDHWMRIAQAPDLQHDNRRIMLFLRDLSVQFDRLWMQSHDDATLRLLHPGQPSRSDAAVALVLAIADVIRTGLRLQGLDAAEEIR